MLPCWCASPFCCMTVPATYQHRWSCSPRRGERWMPSHQQEVPWCSTSRGQSTRETLLGPGNCSCSKSVIPYNDRAEPPNWTPMWTTLPEASSSSRDQIIVAAKKLKRAIASAIKQHWSTLPCVSAVDKTVMRKALKPGEQWLCNTFKYSMATNQLRFNLL